MRTAAKVLYLVSGIMALISTLICLIFGICGLAGALPNSDIIIELQKEFPEFTLELLMGMYVSLIVAGGLNAVLAFAGYYGYHLCRIDSTNQGFHIFAVIIAIIGGVDIILLLAGILALSTTPEKKAE